MLNLSIFVRLSAWLNNQLRPARLDGDISRTYVLAYGFLAGLIALSFFPTFRGWFANDDFLWLEISTPVNVFQSFYQTWGHGEAFRPLSRMSFLFDYWLFGDWAPGWRSTNLILHWIVCCLFFRVVWRVSNDYWLGILSAGLFAVAMIHGDVVLWISGRTHSLALLLVLLALFLFQCGIEKRALKYILCSALSLGLSILAYEAGVYGLGGILLLSVIQLYKSRHQNVWATSRWLIMAMAICGMAMLAIILYRAIIVSGGKLYGAFGEVISLDFLYVYAHAYGTAFLLAFGVTGLILMFFRRRESYAIILGGLIIVLGYLPFLPLGNTVGSRFFYASELGLCLLMAGVLIGLTRLVGEYRQVRAGNLIVAIIAISVFGQFIAHAHSTARAWEKAGVRARDITRGIAREHPEFHATDVLYVRNLPMSHGRGQMFLTYFDKALRREYDHPIGIVLAAPGAAVFGTEFGFFQLRIMLHLQTEQLKQMGYQPSMCINLDILNKEDFSLLLDALHQCNARVVNADDL